MSVLSTIANFQADFVSTCGYPCPKSVIIKENDLTDYQYSKEIKKLKDEGLIKFSRWVETDEYDYYFIQGWYLTPVGKKTLEYKQAYARVRSNVKKCFDFEIEEVAE